MEETPTSPSKCALTAAILLSSMESDLLCGMSLKNVDTLNVNIFNRLTYFCNIKFKFSGRYKWLSQLLT